MDGSVTMTRTVAADEASAARPIPGVPRIYLCGPIAAAGEPARGGYQSCNRRSIDALRAEGVDVVALPYPHPQARGPRKFLEYTIGFLRLYARLARCRRGSIVHITALGGRFVYNEWPLLRLARLRGCGLVYDRRAGTSQRQYEQRGAVYRALFRACVRAADVVMVEGEVLLPFVAAFARAAPVYLPNHIDTDALAWREAEATLPAAPTIAYAGRIVAEKGIEVLLGVAELLRARGMPVRVRIAGSGEPGYVRRLQAQFSHLDVDWAGALPGAGIIELLREAHLFVFPTRHVGEGQSNALTEAMACGCVPIASRHGFNEAVIGDAALTLPVDAAPAAYADVVESIWPARWAELSGRMQRRVRERFSTAAAVRTLLEVYRRTAAIAR